MAFQLRRVPNAPWMGRDGHAMLAAKMGAAEDRLFVMGGWNPGDSYAEQEYFANTRTNDIWVCDSLGDLERGKWTRAKRAAQWSPRHSFGATTDYSGYVNVYGSDVQDGYYVMDHWIGASPGSFRRIRPTNNFSLMPVTDRVLFIPAAIPTIDDTLMIGGETMPSVVGPPHAQQRHTDIWGYRTNDGAWRQVIANCPALPRGAIQKAVVHDIAGVKYLYLYTGGDYDQTDCDKEVWRCPVANLATAGSWQMVTSNAPWVGRIYSCIESFAGALWVIGGSRVGAAGSSTNGNRGDIWYSLDGGLTWTEAPFTIPPRHAHATTVIWNKIIISGGSGDDHRKNDVWVIEDV